MTSVQTIVHQVTQDLQQQAAELEKQVERGAISSVEFYAIIDGDPVLYQYFAFRAMAGGAQ